MGRRALHVRPYRPGDEGRFTARADLAEEFARVGWDWAAGPPGPTWTLVRAPERVLGLGGGYPNGDGSFQVWCALAPLARGEWFPAIMCATAVIGHLQRSHGARRLTVLVRQGFAEAERTMARLGFTRATEPAQFPGYLLMAKGL